jgi:dTDP-4-amino-4,6-dideoxygalactose transaminase
MSKELIPFHKPMFLQQDEQKEIINQIGYVMSSGQLTNNKNVRLLEERISDIHNVDYAISTSSGSQALVIAIQALMKTLNKKPHYAYTQAFTWYSTPYAIKTNNIIPSYCDIETDTWNMKQDTDYPFAVPVHTFGNISEIYADYKIYDGAHCLGAEIDDFGDATILSLAPTKLVTSIEGGIILTNYEKLAKIIIEIRDKVSRMSEIHAIFGNAYLDHLDETLKWKKEVYNFYKENLHGVFQKTDIDSNHNTIGMLTSLKIPGYIETRKYYKPIQHSEVLLNTEEIYKNIVCLPSWFNCPYKQIVEDINNFNKDSQ